MAIQPPRNRSGNYPPLITRKTPLTKGILNERRNRNYTAQRYIVQHRNGVY